MKAKLHTTSAFTALMLGAGLALASAPAAQAMDSQATESHTSAQTITQDRQKQAFPLADAESLMGAKVESQDNQEIGSVKYLMIDPADGQVLLALVQRPHQMDKFIAVPWRKLDVAHWQAGESNGSIALMAPAQVAKNATTYSINDVARLTTPIAQTEMYNVYGVPVPGNQAQSNDSQGNRQAMNEGSAKDDAGGQANGSEQQMNAKSMPFLFVGHEFVGTVNSPAVTLDNKLKGAEVVAQNGQKVGTIKNIVIDLDAGQVAYTLINTEQNLGIGEQSVPVPMTALAWSDQGTYRLEKGEKSNLQGAAEAFSDQSLPADIQSSKLDQLYQRFDAKPYWQQ